MADTSRTTSGATPDVDVDLDESGGLATSINAASRAVKRGIRQQVPEEYRSGFDLLAKYLGIFLALSGVLVVAYTLLNFVFYTVSPLLGMPVSNLRYSVGIRILGFIVLAQMWDLVGGQMGYASFGNITFFGIGVYVMVVLRNGTVSGVGQFGFWPALVASGVVALVFATLVGIPLLRLRGHYFAVASLGVFVATQQIVANLQQTGGGSGINVNRPGFAQVNRTYFLFFFGLTVLTLLVYWYLTRTRFGFGLNAIRDDEGKARATGLPTTKYKATAWGISALFTGFAGGLFAVQNVYVNPHVSFSPAWNIIMILMVLAGGIGRLWGPVIGATLLWQIRNTLWSNPWYVQRLSEFTGFPFSSGYLLIFGLLLVFLVIGAPNGILGYLEEHGVFDLVRDRARGTPLERVLGRREVDQ